MKNYKILTKSGKQIHVFDDVLSYSDRSRIFENVETSFYRFVNSDPHHSDVRNAVNKPICGLSQIDERNLRIFELLPDEINSLLHGFNRLRSYVNAANIGTANLDHTDDYYENLTLLYYVNPHWDYTWGGETFFYNEDLSEIEFASIFKPGRIIVFDGRIPHTATSPNIRAGHNMRFTFAAKYSKSC